MLQEEAPEIGAASIVPDLQKIHGAARHQLGLINDILDLSKIEAGKMTLFIEEFDVPKLVAEVTATIQPLVQKNANQLLVDCPSNLGTLRTDQTKLRQVLFNVLSNACKFTERGRIGLSVERVERDQGKAERGPEAACVAPGQPEQLPNSPAAESPKLTQPLSQSALPRSTLRFTITDSGIGMTPEQLGKLFQAFSQAEAATSKKYGGTGLGLALSRKFCEMMGGDLTVQSTFGKGSIFTLTLPAQLSEAATTGVS
jgi:signal transduction histidine kinase